MLGQLGPQAALQNLLEQSGEQPPGPGHLDLSGVDLLEQAVQGPGLAQPPSHIAPVDGLVPLLSRPQSASVLPSGLTQTIEHAPHPGSWRAVWAHSKKRAARDNRTLDAQANRARAVVAGQRRPKGTRFVTTHKGDQVLDEASLARARSLVGLKGYVTNIPSRLMDAAEVVSSYHELWHVEASFRMSKHDLSARPVFHHTRDAIEAHLTVVMAALAVARHLQDATGMTIKRIIRTLKPLQEITINLNGHHLTAADPPDPRG